MKAEFKLQGLDGAIDVLKSLPPEIVSKRGGPARKALRKAAVVILNAEKANLQRVTSNATESGKVESTGFLLKNLVIRLGRLPTGENGEMYVVRPSRKAYVREGQKVTTSMTARFLEHGTSKQPAEPFARPAVESHGETAIRTVETELLREIGKVVAKLARAKKGK